MSRPLRIEFPGAVYHVTSRGDRREAIYADDADRAQFLAVLARGLERFETSLLVYCLMSNHYHLVLQTHAPNLSLLMRHLNGVYTQDFNRRHGLVGHLFQGRFKAILVDADSYLLALCRYVELNPVRAHMVEVADDWSWSSYQAHTGRVDAPPWLEVGAVHNFMLGRTAQSVEDQAQACLAYAEAVAASAHDESIWTDALRQQIYLGDEVFVARMQLQAGAARSASHEVPQAQRAQAKSLAQWLTECASREQALAMAHRHSGLSMTHIAAELRLSVSRVSQLIKKYEGDPIGGDAIDDPSSTET